MKRITGKTISVFLLAILITFSGCISNNNTIAHSGTLSPNVANLTFPASMLYVNENKIINSNGDEVRLVGVNICGLEWNSSATNVIKSTYEVFANWNCNVVRLPLSQDRWFGKVSDWSTPNPPDGGKSYRDIVDKVINVAASFGKYIILDLHWSNAGVWGENVGQHSMPDDNSLVFWIDVAARYANNPVVLFNLYNEPRDISWKVWKEGGTIKEVINSGKPNQKTLTYNSPGHQKLVDEIRAVGANNLIIAGGIDWGYDLLGIRSGYALTDTPEGNGIAYDSHIYPWKEWDGVYHDIKVLRTARSYPVFIGEIGIDPGGEWGASSRPMWLRNMIDWTDANNLHLIAWCFHTEATPNMISDWNYTPTSHHGAIFKERFLSYANTNAHLKELPK